MTSTEKTKITIGATINAPVEKTWNHWVSPEAIVKRNNAFDDWHRSIFISKAVNHGKDLYLVNI